METDSETETLNCAICNVEVTSEQNLENHILFDHDGKMPFNCSICNGAFASENVLKEHLVSVDCEELNLTDVLDFENRNSNLPLHEDNNKPVESFTAAHFRDKDFENVKNALLVHEEKKPLSSNTTFNSKDSGFENRKVALLDHEEKKAFENSLPAFSPINENFKNGKTTLLVHEVKKPLQSTTSNVRRFCSLCSVNFEAIADFNDHLPCENERDYFKQTFYPTFIAPKVQIFPAVYSQNDPKACSICFDSAKCLCKIEIKAKVDNRNSKVRKTRCDSFAITPVHEAKKLRIDSNLKPLDAKMIILKQANVVEIENIPMKEGLKCNKISSKGRDSKNETSDPKVPKGRLFQSSVDDSKDSGPKIHEVEKFKCEVCGHDFLRKHDMKEHVLEVHENKNLLKCLYCTLRFRGTISLNSHIAKVHEGKKLFTYPDEDREIKCPFCNIYFRYPNGTFLKKHIQMHFKDISEFDYTSHGLPIPCSMCKEWFRHGLSTLMKHISEKHSKINACSICSAKCLCKKVDNLNSKVQKTSCDSLAITPVHEAKKLKIKSNVKSLDAKIIILEQAKVVEIENIPTKEGLKCSLCFTDSSYCECRKFSSKETDSKNEYSNPKVLKRGLSTLMKDNSDNNQIGLKTCSICNAKVTSITDHIVSFHAKKNEKCPYCAQAFALKQEVKSHISSVHEKNIYL